MTKPIRATRDNLLPGTIWQNAAGTAIIEIRDIGMHYIKTNMLGFTKLLTKNEFLGMDIWYKVQPIKEAT